MHAQSCLTLCNHMNCSPSGFSVHGILQARILQWVAISFSRGSSWPRDQTHVSCVPYSGRWILDHCTTWEAPAPDRPLLISTVYDWNPLNEEPDIGLIIRSLFGKWSQEVPRGSGEMRRRRGGSWDRYVNELVITLGQGSSSPLENLGNFIDLNPGCTPPKGGARGKQLSPASGSTNFPVLLAAPCRGQAHSSSQRKAHSESYRLFKSSSCLLKNCDAEGTQVEYRPHCYAPI